jgi:hypothetical protein
MERKSKHMKKFGKFIFGTAILASIAAGAYYIYKTYIKKDSTDDFDDFEDDFEDFDSEEEDSEEDSREYVSINLDSDNESKPETSGDDEAEEASSGNE